MRWLRDHEVSDTLVKELMEESTLVWSFIMEREIESPERFQAIQSYRAAMAVLRQQVHYIEQLRDSGMIDEAEEGMLLKYVQSTHPSPPTHSLPPTHPPPPPT